MIGYLKAGLLCTCLAVFLTVIPAAVPYWWKHIDEGGITPNDNSTNTTARPSAVLSYGTFRWCLKQETGADKCYSYTDPPTWLTVTFVLLFVAIGLLTISAVMSVLFINVYTSRKNLCVMAAWFALLGAAADVASLLLFGVNASDFFKVGSYNAAFGVPVGAIVFAFIGAALLFRYRNAEHKQVSL